MMCWVGMENVLKVVKVLTTGTGCQYIINGKVQKRITALIQEN